jgi:hypothetical protein
MTEIGAALPDGRDFGMALAEQAGVIDWPALQRHFARGVVVVVAEGIDLLEAAQCFARDDAAIVAAWIEAGHIAKATEDHARHWQATPPALRAIVLAPWVLVQQISSAEGRVEP